MSRQSFLEGNKLTQIITPAAGVAATTDIDSTSVDMKDFDEVALAVTFGAITGSAVTSIHAEQSADDSSFTDIEGTNQTVADSDDGDTFVIDIIKPSKRYVRLVVDRATQNAVVASAHAIQPRAKVTAVTQGTTINSETFVTPDEGTI